MARARSRRTSTWMPDKGPEALREIVSQLISARGWGRRQGQLKYERAWAEVVGEKYARQSRCTGLKRGVIEVLVASAVLQHELNFHKRRLLEQLRGKLAGAAIHDLRFRAGAWQQDEPDDRKS